MISLGLVDRRHDSSYVLLRYFSLQATNPLGFGDSVRMEIESNICREGGPLPDCFNTPLRQAWTTMEKVGYVTSTLSCKCVQGMIKMEIHTEVFSTSGLHARIPVKQPLLQVFE